MNHDWFPEMIHQSHFPSPPPFQKTEPWRTSSHFLHKETTSKIFSTKKCTIFNPRNFHPTLRSSPAQRDRHQSVSSVGWMTSWLSLGSARPCDLCTVPKTWGKAAGSRKCDLDQSNLSLQKDPPGNSYRISYRNFSIAGFRGLSSWGSNEGTATVPVFQAKPLFFGRRKGDNEIDDPLLGWFFGFFDRSQILGTFYPRDLSRGHKMVVKDQPVAKASWWTEYKSFLVQQ